MRGRDDPRFSSMNSTPAASSRSVPLARCQNYVSSFAKASCRQLERGDEVLHTFRRCDLLVRRNSSQKLNGPFPVKNGKNLILYVVAVLCVELSAGIDSPAPRATWMR